MEPSGTEDLVTSVLAVGLAVVGIWLAWALYVSKRVRVPDVPALQRLLERKCDGDDAYDFAFYRPAVWVSTSAYRCGELPRSAGAIRGLASSARLLSGRTSEIQSGLLRTYVLALGSGAALLALVFLAVRA